MQKHWLGVELPGNVCFPPPRLILKSLPLSDPILTWQMGSLSLIPNSCFSPCQVSVSKNQIPCPLLLGRFGVVNFLPLLLLFLPPGHQTTLRAHILCGRPSSNYLSWLPFLSFTTLAGGATIFSHSGIGRSADLTKVIQQMDGGVGIRTQ